jgi:hypothetical protein
MSTSRTASVFLPPAAFGATAPSCLADLDDDGQDEVVFYCPVCAGHEFHGVE